MIVAAPHGWVEVAGGLVVALGDGRPPRRPSRRVDGTIAAGLVDLQLNGAAGFEVTGGPTAVGAIDALLLDHGVTAYLATVVSTGDDAAARAAAELAERAADPSSPLAGIHFEGPFLSAAHRGAHRAEMLRARYDGVLPEAYRSPAARLVTLAPELPGALDLVAELRRRGVAVSLGHSGADAEVAARAVDAGARMVTHLFNAMGPLGHRAPGLAGVALADRRVRVGVIADGAHVDPLVLRLVRRVAGPRVRLVSDAAPAAGGPDGDGVLAGSALLLDEAMRRWSAFTGAPLEEALRAASAGARLRVGAPANLVVVAEDGTVGGVMLSGDWVR